MEKIDFQEFIDKTLGKRIDTDGYPPDQPYQCVDLPKYYNECYFHPFQIYCGDSGYAKDWANQKYTNGIFDYYDEVKTTEMIKGTLVVWGNCRVAPYSHIGFFVKDNCDGTFQCLQQNAPYPYVTLSNITYEGLIGAFIPKNIKRNEPIPPTPENPDYITLGEMYLRRNPYLSANHILVREMSEDGKKHATSTNPNAWAVYREGTIFTVFETAIENDGRIWGRTPSGWITLKGATGKEYCRKV